MVVLLSVPSKYFSFSPDNENAFKMPEILEMKLCEIWL